MVLVQKSISILQVAKGPSHYFVIPNKSDF